jgi:hypothetical protein
VWFVASWPTRNSPYEGVGAWLGAMQWATSTSTVIKCLFEVNAIFIKLRSTRWVTRWCFYHTLPTLILLTPDVHFLVNMKSVSQLSADNSNSFVCLHDASVLYVGPESMNTRTVDSGWQLPSSVYTRDAHYAARARHFPLTQGACKRPYLIICHALVGENEQHFKRFFKQSSFYLTETNLLY